MKIKNLITLIGCVCCCVTATTALTSCGDDDLDATSVIKDSTQPKTDFDRWLDKNFRQNYNIELKYRLNDYETDFTYTLVPADVNNSIKLAHIILHTWLQAYDEVAGQNFTRQMAPKVLQFVGSVAWQTDNTAIMGQAEDGMKVTLFGVNQLALTKAFLNDNYFQSMHHEFTHILAQSKDYDTNFQKISEGYYQPANWRNSPYNTETYALKHGFLSNYAESEYNEDFAETLAFYLIYTPAEWAAKLVAADKRDAGDAGTELDNIKSSETIEKKLAMVRSYMQSAWDIDIDELRTVVQRRMDEVVTGKVNLDDLSI